MANKIKTLYRSKTDKWLGGVCGGIGDYTNIDPVIIRLIWAFSGIATFGLTILMYILACVMIPEQK